MKATPRCHFGTPIEVGDFIAYPGRWGAHLWMRAAVVLRVLPKGLRVRVAKSKKETYVTTITRLDLVVHVIPPRWMQSLLSVRTLEEIVAEAEKLGLYDE